MIILLVAGKFESLLNQSHFGGNRCLKGTYDYWTSGCMSERPTPSPSQVSLTSPSSFKMDPGRSRLRLSGVVYDRGKALGKFSTNRMNLARLLKFLSLYRFKQSSPGRLSIFALSQRFRDLPVGCFSERLFVARWLHRSFLRSRRSLQGTLQIDWSLGCEL